MLIPQNILRCLMLIVDNLEGVICYCSSLYRDHILNRKDGANEAIMRIEMVEWEV